MKKLIFTLTLLFIIIFPVSIFADTNIDSYLNNNYAEEKTESTEISSIQQASYDHAKDIIFQHQSDYFKGKIKIDNKDDITFGTPYKVYMLGDLKKIKDNGKITDDLADYYWEVTVYLNSNGEKTPISTIQFRKSDTEGWQLAMINGYLEPTLSDIVSNKSKFETFLKGQNITQLDNYVHFQLNNMDFLYIADNNKESIIPLFNNDAGNMNVLKKNDYSEFKTYIGNVLANSNSTGGPSTKPDNMMNTYYKTYIIIGISIVAIGIGTFLIIKRLKANHA